MYSEESVKETYYPDSTLMEIVYKQGGKVNGKAFKFNPNGTKLWEFNYVNDRREGLQYTFDRNGKLVWIEDYRERKLNGWARCYAGPCGLLSQEGQYLDDKMHGLWYEYYGVELLEVDLYSNDSLVRVIYRNKTFADRTGELPDLNMDCASLVSRTK